jgi:peptidoglycan/LPS O-acetylase OafA/YrhL
MNYQAPNRLQAAVIETSRLPEIEALRAIAILMVLVEHIPFNLDFWPSHIVDAALVNSGLWTGVDLFFAISGFVIARSLLPRLEGVRDMTVFLRISAAFWIQRAWRLLPSSWAWLVMPMLLCLVFNHSHAYGTPWGNFEMMIAGMMDIANFHEGLVYGSAGDQNAAFPQWSLSLEEQFYIFLPFAAFFLRRWLVFLLMALAVGGFFASSPGVMTYMLRVWPVAAGVLLALWSSQPSYRDLAPEGLAKSRVARFALLGISLLCLVAFGTVSIHIVSFFQGPITVIVAVLVWLASYDKGLLWQHGPVRQVMQLIAARSYSLYLIHIPVYFAAHEIWYRLYKLATPSYMQAGILVVSAYAALGLLVEANHRLLEEPLRAHGKQLAANFRARTMGQTA